MSLSGNIIVSLHVPVGFSAKPKKQTWGVLYDLVSVESDVSRNQLWSVLSCCGRWCWWLLMQAPSCFHHCSSSLSSWTVCWACSVQMLLLLMELPFSKRSNIWRRNWRVSVRTSSSLSFVCKWRRREVEYLCDFVCVCFRGSSAGPEGEGSGAAGPDF